MSHFSLVQLTESYNEILRIKMDNETYQFQVQIHVSMLHCQHINRLFCSGSILVINVHQLAKLNWNVIGVLDLCSNIVVDAVYVPTLYSEWLMQFCPHAEKPQGNRLLLFIIQRYVFTITKTCIYALYITHIYKFYICTYKYASLINVITVITWRGEREKRI